MWKPLCLALVCACIAPAQTSSILPLADDSVVSVRIRFGVTDQEPRAWDGTLSVKGGELLRLRNWRPRPEQHVGGNGWRMSTEPGVNFKNRSWEPEPAAGPVPYLLVPGVIVDLKGAGSAAVSVKTRNGSFDFRPASLSPGLQERYLGGAVVVDWVPTSQQISGTDGQNDFATILATPAGDVWTAWVSYSGWKNEVRARRHQGSQWSEVQKISGDHDDIFLVKAGRDGRGGVWMIWSARVEGNFDLYGRRFADGTWSASERLTTAPQPDIYHALATDSKGNLWLTWQGFRRGRSQVFVRQYDGEQWSAEESLSALAGNAWEPAIAADSKGRVYVGWDTYAQGNYDVVVRKLEKGEWVDLPPLTGTPKFEAHVSLACDSLDRLWAAWNEAGTQWGKDTGFLVRREGTPLYRARWMAVAVLDDGQWKEPAAEIAASLPEHLRGHNDLPLLQSDGNGGIWLIFRHRNPRIRDVPSDAGLHRATWEIYATNYAATQWSAPVAVPFSQAREDVRMGVDSDSAGNLYLAWPMDNRDYESFLIQQADVFAARIPGAGRRAAVMPQLVAREPAQIRTFPLHGNEQADVNRIRGYRIRSGGKEFRIYRGDVHRHTEFSHDGHNDGSLIDTYRYSFDAAALDYVMVSEHNDSGGPDVDYVNWLLQQMSDVLLVPGRFVPLFGYERSVSYPDGHRNVVFASRGNPALTIPPEERDHKTGAKALFAYLKKYDGISIPHTSATGMGTDWRDNDPEVETLVEIFQGDRVSAEYEGAPKAAWGGKETTHAGGFRKPGYVWNAWAKGYKLGVQASSDHLSTHISYACTVAEEFTRDGLLGAMKQRHSYGATDNIILDYRLRDGDREFIQGDILSSGGRFSLWVKVIGTADFRQIDIIKNNTFLHTRQPMSNDVEFTFQDTHVEKGENYYYVRVQQADDQMAWSSPIWVTIK